MDLSGFKLLLADDDIDDCMLFKEALAGSPARDLAVSTVNDGVHLMQWLHSNTSQLPDVLFLDLNMPRKNGFECLSEIKDHQNLKRLPVIIFSTALDHSVIDRLYNKGAHYYMRKPGEFLVLRQLIHKAIMLIVSEGHKPTPKEKFLLTN